MKEIELTTNKPTTMTIFANAVYDTEKKQWEVIVQQMGTNTNVKDGKPTYFQSCNKFFIKDQCDELVIPIAILEDNGINAKELFKD